MRSGPSRGRALLRVAALVLFVVLVSAAAGLSLAAREPRPGIFVLGVDGVDPVIARRMMDEGRLPNLRKLAEEGTFQSLGTSTPPQSPVAWSDFVTGRNPGGHGIYDFVHRDPKTYAPISSATPPHDGDAPPTVEIMGYIIPLGGEELENNRSGIPFWDRLAAEGVPVEVYRIPGNYPPPSSEARTLSGMGTVDLRGEYGTYTWYTSQPLPAGMEVKGDVQLVTVEDEDLDGTPDTVNAMLKGAPDVFHLRPGQIPGPGDFLTTGVEIHVDPLEDTAWLRLGGEDVLLQQGEWSDWVSVDFDALPMGLMPLSGIVRFYLKQVRPVFQLYASPVNIAPSDPAQAITTPDDFAGSLYEELGDFFTQGMPEETNALKDRLFDDDDYEQQVKLVQQDAGRMLEVALSRFRPGATTFFYLSDIDLQCHMLWRHHDPKYPGAPRHPAFEPEAAADHADDIEGYYEHVDALLGRVRSRLPEGTLLIVMSDHGFQPFTRTFNLNGWLRDEGYLALAEGRTGRIAVPGEVDWSRTRAYGLGFNGVYLNLAGREGQGVVTPAEADALAEEIAEKLLAVRDPKTGARVVLRVDRARDVYSGERIGEAPDLIVGYDKGYGASDESTLGEVEELVLEDNVSRWSGNHLMAPEVVPGVLLVNRKLESADHQLTDLTASLLHHYGIEPDSGMVGQSIFRD